MQAARGGVQVADGGLHPVHKVRFLVDVARQMNTHARVNLLLERLWCGLLDAPAFFVIACVCLPVQVQLAQGRLPHLFEQRLDHKLVHDSRLLSRAGDHRRVWVAAQNLLNLLQSGVAGVRPSLMPPTDVCQLLRRGGRCPQELQLLPQLLVLTAPHLVQVDHKDASPLWAICGLAVVDAGQLPEVSGEDQGRELVGRLPHLKDPLKLPGVQLRDLVYHHQIILRQGVQVLVGSLLPQPEGSGAGVHVGGRVSGPDPGRQLGCRQRVKHAPAALQHPVDAAVEHRGLARAGRAKPGDRPCVLACGPAQLVQLVHILYGPRRGRALGGLQDVVLQKLLLPVELQAFIWDREAGLLKAAAGPRGVPFNNVACQVLLHEVALCLQLCEEGLDFGNAHGLKLQLLRHGLLVAPMLGAAGQRAAEMPILLRHLLGHRRVNQLLQCPKG